MADALNRLLIKPNLLEYMIKPMILTCSLYNISGYKVFISIY
jgi:hypothetical protein